MKRLVIVLLFAIVALVANAQGALKKVYDESLDPIEQIDKALSTAKNSGKFVVCQVGGNWCPWCLLFADFIRNDSTISKLIDENFVYIHVNYNPRQQTTQVQKEHAEEMMQRLGYPARFGYPVFVILDENGRVIHIQDSSFLEEGKSYNREKVIRFFSCWTPSAVKH